MNKMEEPKSEFQTLAIYESENTEKVINISKQLQLSLGSRLTPFDLSSRYLDVFHYSWDLAELDEFAEFFKSQSGKETKDAAILDLGSGICGPARYLAWKHKFIVNCMELMETSIETANKLNSLFKNSI